MCNSIPPKRRTLFLTHFKTFFWKGFLHSVQGTWLRPSLTDVLFWPNTGNWTHFLFLPQYCKFVSCPYISRKAILYTKCRTILPSEKLMNYNRSIFCLPRLRLGMPAHDSRTLCFYNLYSHTRIVFWLESLKMCVVSRGAVSASWAKTDGLLLFEGRFGTF